MDEASCVAMLPYRQMSQLMSLVNHKWWLCCETFLEFVEVKDKTGLTLSNSIKHVLEPPKLGDKLIAQTMIQL